MAVDPRWKERYRDPDTSFTAKTVTTLTTIRTKFSTDYRIFFDKMLRVYSPTGTVGRELAKGFAKVQRVVYNIDRLLGQGARPATEAEINTLFNDIQEVEQLMQWCQATYAKSIKFKKQADLIQAMHNVSLDNLAAVSKEIDKELSQAQLKGDSAKDLLKKYAPEMYNMASELGGIAKMGIFGPFSGLADVAIGGITGMFKRRQARQEARHRESTASRLGATGFDLGGEFFGGSGRAGGAGGGAGGGGFGGFGGGGGGHGGFYNAGGVGDLFSFFDSDHGAYKARWTKELITLLRTMAGIPQAGAAAGGASLAEQALEFLGLTELAEGIAAVVAGFGELALAIGGVVAIAGVLQGLKGWWEDIIAKAKGGDVAAKQAVQAGEIATTAAQLVSPTSLTNALPVPSMKGIKPMPLPFAAPGGNIGLDFGGKVAAAIIEGMKKVFPDTGTSPAVGSKQPMYRPDDPYVNLFNLTDEAMA